MNQKRHFKTREEALRVLRAEKTTGVVEYTTEEVRDGLPVHGVFCSFGDPNAPFETVSLEAKVRSREQCDEIVEHATKTIADGERETSAGHVRVREFTTKEEAHQVLHEEDPQEMTPYVVLRNGMVESMGVYVPKSFEGFSQEELRRRLDAVLAEMNANPPAVLRSHAGSLAKARSKFQSRRPDELTRNQRKKLRQIAR